MSETLALARYNMIHQQIRPFEIFDAKVVELLERLDRRDFAPEPQKKHAYFDISIPLPCGQQMLEPKTEAKMLQALALQPTDKTLEVGTGSGFFTACLASLGQHVFSYDIHQELTECAASQLTAHNIKNVTLKTGDAFTHWDNQDQYDAIVFTGATHTFNEEWKQRLKVGGRLLLFLGEGAAECILITRTGNNSFDYTSLFDLYAPLLLEADQEPKFDF